MKKLSAIDRRDILTGIVVLLVLAGVVYLLRRPGQQPVAVPTPTPIDIVEQRIEDTFRVTIPDDVEKTDLQDVSGGTGGGIATRTEILAELPDPAAGYFYQAWLEKDGNLVSLGKMRMAKGGYLIEYNSLAYPGYNKVVVSLERVFDNKLEKRVLEGTFK